MNLIEKTAAELLALQVAGTTAVAIIAAPSAGAPPATTVVDGPGVAKARASAARSRRSPSLAHVIAPATAHHAAGWPAMKRALL